MKNYSYMRIGLCVLSLFMAVPVWPSAPQAHPAQAQPAVEQQGDGRENARSLKKLENLMHLFNLGIEAGNISLDHGPEHILPTLGQQAGYELAHRGLARSCHFQSPYQKYLAYSALDSAFEGIVDWYRGKRNLKNLLWAGCKQTAARFVKRTAVHLMYRGLINGANYGLENMGSSHRLGRYPRWATNNMLFLMLAMELPGWTKGFLGSVYDNIVYGSNQEHKNAGKSRGRAVVNG